MKNITMVERATALTLPSTTRLDAWRRARKVLCVRLDNMGDVLMTTPAVRALKQSAPDRRIVLLGSDAGVHAARYVPEIDEAIAYDAPWVKHERDAGRDADFAMIDRLRGGEFDAAVIFTVYTQSALPAALLCRLAGIPLRLAHTRENPYELLTNWVRDPEPRLMRHEVERQLDLVASIDCAARDRRLSFDVPAQDRASIRTRLNALGIRDDEQWILATPGATAPSRRYPPELFAQALQGIAQRLRCPIVFGGTRAESALIDEIRARMSTPSHSFAGQCSLGEFGALISQARVLVSNNSGPVHIAAALGTPVVDLYALTNPQHTPWLVEQRVLSHDVPCKYCFKSICPEGHHDCLRKIAPLDVVDACAQLFEARDVGCAAESTTIQ